MVCFHNLYVHQPTDQTPVHRIGLVTRDVLIPGDNSKVFFCRKVSQDSSGLSKLAFCRVGLVPAVNKSRTQLPTSISAKS